MTLYRCSRPGSYGLMGDTFNSTHTMLARVFAEDDRQRADFERWEWEREQRCREESNKQTAAAPTEETVSASDRRVIKRSCDDGGIERVWIEGYSKSECMIHGIASTPTIDAQNTSMLSRGCILHVPVPLLWRHAEYGGPIGEVVFMQKDESKIYVHAAIHDHEAGRYAWQLIERGEFSGLSCGFEPNSCHIQAEVGGVRFYDRFRISEISLTPSPANSDCFFEIYSLSEEELPDERRTHLRSAKAEKSPGLSYDERKRFDAWYNKIQKGVNET